MGYLAIIVGLFTLDFVIKSFIEHKRKLGDKTEHLKGLIIIQKYHNKGAFLNLGEKKQKLVGVISVLLCVFLTGVFVMSLGKYGSRPLRAGLAVLLGGAYSNTYDRLRQKYVVDYLSFNVPLKPIRQIVFNISDFCIMIGAMLSVIAYQK